MLHCVIAREFWYKRIIAPCAFLILDMALAATLCAGLQHGQLTTKKHNAIYYIYIHTQKTYTNVICKYIYILAI